MAKKKEKIILVDDGRTIADMSGVGPLRGGPPKESADRKPLKYRAPLKEQLRTFFDAMGLMLLPTMAIVGMLLVIFLIMYIIL